MVRLTDCLELTIAVDTDVKRQNRQTNKYYEYMDVHVCVICHRKLRG